MQVLKIEETHISGINVDTDGIKHLFSIRPTTIIVNTHAYISHTPLTFVKSKSTGK